MAGGHPNLYVYCANDPVNGKDPSGLQEDDDPSQSVWGRIDSRGQDKAKKEVNKKINRAATIAKSVAEISLEVNPINTISRAAGYCNSREEQFFSTATIIFPFLGVLKIQRVPILGRKLKYLLGKASGDANVARSRGLLEELKRIGMNETKETELYLKEFFTRVLNDPSNVVKEVIRGGSTRQIRESLLMGPKGGCQVTSIWEGDKLITVYLKHRR